MPNRNGRRVDPIADSRDDSTDNHLRNNVIKSIEESADDEDGASEPDCTTTSEIVTGDVDEERSEKAPNLVDCHHRTLKLSRAVIADV